jgi:D-proline reductase (dithiol) PrdB
VSLISRVLESEGIPTVGLSINRDWSEKVPAPRTAFVKHPYGAPFGEPRARDQQMAVVLDLLRLLRTATAPGRIVDLPYRWRRTTFPAVDLSALDLDRA